LNFELEKPGPEPLYIQVQGLIKQKIANGDWKPKQKLPSEADLAELLKVSRGTVKQAIKQLVWEGILTQIHGKGTFVTGDPLEYPLAERLISVAETMIENQKDFSTRLLELKQIEADRPIRDILRLAPEQRVYYLKRLRFYEETPVVLIENYLPADMFSNLERFNFAEKTLFSIIEEEFNIMIDWGKRSFYAKAADGATAKLLQIETGTPVTFLEQTTYSEENVPIECSRVWIRNDQVKLTSILKRTVR
jgi:GntR family transcriptional regulator